MKRYTLKAVFIFTALTFVFPLFILLIAKVSGAQSSESMIVPYILCSWVFLTYFYAKFIQNKFKLSESVVFAFIISGVVVAILLKFCLTIMRFLGMS